MEEVVFHGDAVLLEGRSSRGLGMDAGFAAMAGVLLLVVGVAIPVFGFALLLVVPDALHHVWTESPQGLYLLIGGPIVILAGGYALTRYGVLNLRRKSRAAELAALNPGQPWYSDWAWDPRGTVQEPTSSGVALFVLVFLFVMCAMFTAVTVNALTTWRDQAPRMMVMFMVAIVGFWDFILLRVLYSLARGRLRRLRDGRARLRFESFPFFLGGPLRGQITADALAGRRGVSVTLRCLEERFGVARSTSGRRTKGVQVYQVYVDRRQIDDRMERGVGVPIEFALPSGSYGSRLTTEPFRYWELEVESAEADAIRFLLPVYPP